MTTPPRSERQPTLVERKSDVELVVTRLFRASPARLFTAWTEPEYLLKWWAPKSRGVTLFECTADVRVGGRYRYLFGQARHEAMAFSGEYREVVPAKRLVYTECFEPMAHAGSAVVTAQFVEEGEHTRLLLSEVFPSKEALDATIASGMEGGMRETIEQLAALFD